MTSKTDTADQALTLGDRVQADRVHTSLYTDPAIFGSSSRWLRTGTFNATGAGQGSPADSARRPSSARVSVISTSIAA